MGEGRVLQWRGDRVVWEVGDRLTVSLSILCWSTAQPAMQEPEAVHGMERGEGERGMKERGWRGWHRGEKSEGRSLHTVLSLSLAISSPARCLQEVSELFRRNLCSPSTTHSSQTPPSTRHWSPTHSSMASHPPLCTAISNASIAYIQYIDQLFILYVCAYSGTSEKDIYVVVIFLPPKRGQPLYIG